MNDTLYFNPKEHGHLFRFVFKCGYMPLNKGRAWVTAGGLRKVDLMPEYGPTIAHGYTVKVKLFDKEISRYDVISVKFNDEADAVMFKLTHL